MTNEKLWKCWNCSRVSEGAKEKHTSYETYFAAPIGSRTDLVILVCPFCGSDELDEVRDLTKEVKELKPNEPNYDALYEVAELQKEALLNGDSELADKLERKFWNLYYI